eukprot:gene5300-3803_t
MFGHEINDCSSPMGLGGPRSSGVSSMWCRSSSRRRETSRHNHGNYSQRSRDDSTSNSQSSAKSSLTRQPYSSKDSLHDGSPNIPNYGSRSVLPPVRNVYGDIMDYSKGTSSTLYPGNDSVHDDHVTLPAQPPTSFRRYTSDVHLGDKHFHELRTIPETISAPDQLPDALGLAQTPVGLQSLGNTCYMNAALQCILHTPGFLDALSEVLKLNVMRERIEGSGRALPRVSSSTPASAALCELGREDPHRDETRRSQAHLLRTIKASAAKYNEQFESDQQNDAHEFIRTFLTVVHDEVNVGKGRNGSYEEIKEVDEETEPEAYARWRTHLKAVDDSVVYDHFGGMLRSRSECRKCGHVSFTFDPFLDLTLFFTGNDARSVTTVLRRDYQNDTPEDLRGENRLFCPKCRKKQPSLRATCVLNWPRNLVLHLNRFLGDGSKDSSKITYPVFFTVVNLKYRLYAVCCHSGTTKGGHYTSYVAVDQETNTPKLSRFPNSPTLNLQTWFFCNDNNISTVSSTESSSHTTAAYILFYCLIEIMCCFLFVVLSLSHEKRISAHHLKVNIARLRSISNDYHSTYLLYPIKLRTATQNQMVTRRYTDFEDFRSRLNSLYWYCVIPPLPEKETVWENLGISVAAGHHETIGQTRRFEFTRFLEHVYDHPIIKSDPLLTKFMDDNQWFATLREGPAPVPVFLQSSSLSSVAQSLLKKAVLQTDQSKDEAAIDVQHRHISRIRDQFESAIAITSLEHCACQIADCKETKSGEEEQLLATLNYWCHMCSAALEAVKNLNAAHSYYTQLTQKLEVLRNSPDKANAGAAAVVKVQNMEKSKTELQQTLQAVNGKQKQQLRSFQEEMTRELNDFLPQNHSSYHALQDRGSPNAEDVFQIDNEKYYSREIVFHRVRVLKL